MAKADRAEVVLRLQASVNRACAEGATLTARTMLWLDAMVENRPFPQMRAEFEEMGLGVVVHTTEFKSGQKFVPGDAVLIGPRMLGVPTVTAYAPLTGALCAIPRGHVVQVPNWRMEVPVLVSGDEPEAEPALPTVTLWVPEMGVAAKVDQEAVGLEIVGTGLVDGLGLGLAERNGGGLISVEQAATLLSCTPDALREMARRHGVVLSDDGTGVAC